MQASIADPGPQALSLDLLRRAARDGQALNLLKVPGTGPTVWSARIALWLLLLILAGWAVASVITVMTEGSFGSAITNLVLAVGLGALAIAAGRRRALRGPVTAGYVVYIVVSLVIAALAWQSAPAVAVVAMVWTAAFITAVEARRRL